MLLSRNVTSPIFFKIASFLTFIADCNELYQKPVFCNSRDKCSHPFASEKLPLLRTRFFITFKSISSRDARPAPARPRENGCPGPPRPRKFSKLPRPAPPRKCPEFNCYPAPPRGFYSLPLLATRKWLSRFFSFYIELFFILCS